ncbi:hypothetical protein [Actinacidiphila glaucinigra]|uniref:hypothetical protein n=1 Tax=Actinacidiphila glaucinigra TaxID=235986 RepID=UPI00366F022E
MAVVVGDRSRFAAEVGEWDHGLRRVDLWAAGQWLTCDDNMAFVKQFRLAVLDTAMWLRSGQVSPPPFDGQSPAAAHRHLMLHAGDDDETEAEYELRSRFSTLHWGPTTDNVTAHLFRDGDRLAITLQFRREEHLRRHPEHAGEIFVAVIAAAELVGVLEDLVAVLDGRQNQPPATG